ncbi:MAG: DNA-deoxyinosine glycosylase [Eubacteriales bacterium]|nr:DNA-deoxyinosine glycosylase [Eubacteriales bacterium]
MAAQKVYHELEPVYDGNSRILVLGTMPSPKSRAYGFYYSHPQNRLWKVLAEILREPVPETAEDKERLLRRHKIAMWDVLKSCSIQGADDSTILDPEPNDIRLVLSASEIGAVFTTGRKATELYAKLCYPDTGRSSIYLPSTSPANCRNFTYESLVEAYRIILDYLAVD